MGKQDPLTKANKSATRLNILHVARAAVNESNKPLPSEISIAPEEPMQEVPNTAISKTNYQNDGVLVEYRELLSDTASNADVALTATLSFPQSYHLFHCSPTINLIGQACLRLLTLLTLLLLYVYYTSLNTNTKLDKGHTIP